MVDIIVRYVNGKAVAIKVSEGIADRFNLVEGREIPIPLLLYLVYIGKAEVIDDKGRSLLFEDLLSSIRDKDSFSVFIVLYDLAKKGKQVAIGDGARELVLTDEKIKVYVLDEDSYILAEDLYKLVDRTIKQEHKLVIAVVDVNGEITYYEVSKMDFPKIERR